MTNELMGICRGTTPCVTFALSLDTAELEEVWITFSQKGGATVNKTLADCTAEGSSLTVTLTQQDTLSLDSTKAVQIQLRARTREGLALATRIFTRETREILRDRVI